MQYLHVVPSVSHGSYALSRYSYVFSANVAWEIPYTSTSLLSILLPFSPLPLTSCLSAPLPRLLPSFSPILCSPAHGSLSASALLHAFCFSALPTLRSDRNVPYNADISLPDILPVRR